jgi:hypothetical protein
MLLHTRRHSFISKNKIKRIHCILFILFYFVLSLHILCTCIKGITCALYFGNARGKHDGGEQRTVVHAETFAKVIDGIFFCKFHTPLRTATDITWAGKDVDDTSQTADDRYAWATEASRAIADTSAERGRIWFWRSVHGRRHLSGC